MDIQYLLFLQELRIASGGIFDEVFVTRAGCTVSSHCGANTLGVLFIRNSVVE